MRYLSWKATMVRLLEENSGMRDELPQPVTGTKISHPQYASHSTRRDREEVGEGKTKILKYLREFCEEALELKESAEVEKCHV